MEIEVHISLAVGARLASHMTPQDTLLFKDRRGGTLTDTFCSVTVGTPSRRLPDHHIAPRCPTNGIVGLYASFNRHGPVLGSQCSSK